MKLKYLLTIATGITLLGSCIKNDDLDPSKISSSGDYGISVNLPLTLGTANLTFKDLELAEDSIIKFDTDTSIVRFVITQDLFDYKPADLLTTPDEVITKGMTIGSIAIPNITQQLTSPLSTAVNSFPTFPIDVKKIVTDADSTRLPIFPAVPPISLGNQENVSLTGFTSATFSSGSITVGVTNNWGFDVEGVVLEIRNSANATVETLNFGNLKNGIKSEQMIPFSGKTIGNIITPSVPSIGIPNQSNVLIDLSSNLVIDVNSNNLVITSGTADIDEQTITESINQGLTFDADDADLKTLTLDSGVIKIDIDKYQFGSAADVTISVPSITSSAGTPLSVSFLNLNATTSKTINLKDYKVTFGDNNSITGSVVANIKAKTDATFNSTDEVNATISLTGLKPAEITGFIGKQSIDIPGGSFDADLALEGFEDISITFADPKLKLIVTNTGIDIPLTGALTTLRSVNTNTPDSIDITYTQDILSGISEGSTSTIELSNATTNGTLSKAIELMPNKFTYAFSGSTNPNGNTGTDNVISNKANIKAELEIDIPVHASITGASITDTLDFNIGEDTDFFKSLSLVFTTENAFPIETDSVFIYSVDSLGNNSGILATLSNLLKTNLDANGKVAAPTFTTNIIEFEGDKLEQLKNSKQLIISGQLVAGSPTSPIQLYASDYFKITVGVKAGVKF